MQEPTRYKRFDEKYFEDTFSRSFADRDFDKLHYEQLTKFATEGLEKNSYVLDVGCGAGGVCYRLLERCDNVIGLDVSASGLVKTKSLYCDKKIHFIAANGENIPFKAGIFDRVIVSHLFEHLTDEEAARVQKEIYRVLKVRGSLVVEQPFFGRKSIIDLALMYLFASQKDRKYYFYSLADIKRSRRENPKADFHRLEKVGEASHKRIYDIKLLINELSKAGFSQFKFFRRRLFSILFFNREDLFNRYVSFYIKAPEIIRRIFLIGVGGRLKAIKE